MAEARDIARMLVDVAQNANSGGSANVTGTVEKVDNGVAYVRFDGASELTPVSNAMAAGLGDSVTVMVQDGRAVVTGNLTHPATDDTVAMIAAQQASAVKGIADEAKAIAEATGQHFWDADDGAHVTDVTRDEWEEAVEDGFSDLSDQKPYHNALWNSLGMLFRRALYNLVSISRSAIAFFDGTGNQAANITARFGTDGFQAGTTDKSHLIGDYHSLQLVDNDGGTYFYASDLRNADGEATVTERFMSTGGADFWLQCASVDRIVQAKVNGEAASATLMSSGEQWSARISPTPASGADVEITYIATSDDAKAYTAGVRHNGSTVGAMSFAEGYMTVASGYASHSEGDGTYSRGYASHAEGSGAMAHYDYSHAEGFQTRAWAVAAHAEGYQTQASAGSAHAEGYGTKATGGHSHAEGYQTTASGDRSHAEGMKTTASTYYAHAEGYYATASGSKSHAEGDHTTASGQCSHAEGAETTATAYVAHAEGASSDATAVYSHAEGFATTASGSCAHSEGNDSTASGANSHAQNESTVAASDGQTALGKYNIEDANDAYAVIVGNGTADNARSNALTVDWSGNVECGTVNGTDLPSGVPLLKGATLLASGTDLDDIASTGTYYANSNNAANISNCPVAGAFKLYVERTLSTATYLKQRFELYNGVNQWVRFTTNGGSSWSVWYREAPHSSDSAVANQFLATPNGSNGVPNYRSIVNADLPTVNAAHGGTGETTLGDSMNALIGALGTATATPTDDMMVISETSTGGTGKFFKRKISTIWPWILGKFAPATYDVKSLITQTSTQSGNFTISAASLVVSGFVAMLTVDFTIGAALTANTEYSLGTLPTSIRPAARANAGIGDSRFYAAIANGVMYLRPQAATSAGTSTYRFNSTYIMSNTYTG